jgi:hypothetical protein
MAYTNIDDPSAYFQTALYTGSNNQSITNDGNSDLQPDFVWIKRRSTTEHHNLTNSSTGVNKQLLSSSSNAEQSRTDQIQSFNTDGFTLGTDGAGYTNVPGSTYVAWQWKANGGTTSTNNDGNHTSVVQANQDAGFSIVTYTGTGNTSSTVGHGLGVTPNWIIFKRRDGVGNWDIQIDGTSRATLNLTEAGATNVLSSFSSTTFGLGSVTSNEKNANGSPYVAYCFAEKQGYSKFGSYIGNGNGNGPFVYTGFKPAFVMFKRSTGIQSWDIHDSTRDPFNPMPRRLLPNLTAAEETRPTSGISIDCMDFLSNGFKIRSIETILNASGDTYIYMAFAENPFVTSTGVPTTAR